MARPRRFALALLCAAAAIGGFEWSGIENSRNADLEPRGGRRRERCER